MSVGSPLQLGVTIDLSSVTGTGPSGSTAMVLGGYQVEIAFNKDLFQFVSATGGSSVGFTAPPVFTSASAANSSGTIRIVASQISSTSPTGAVSVAALSFTAVSPGTAAFTPNPLSLSSAFQPPSFGPSLIPATGAAATVTVSGFSGPAPPANLSPADNASSVPAPVVLAWSPGAGATAYQLFFGTDSNPPLYAVATSTSQQVPTSGGTRYYWRVVAINSSGSTTGPTWSFTSAPSSTCAAPDQPQVTAPPSASSAQSYTVTWMAGGSATASTVEESTAPSFSGEVVQQFPSAVGSATFAHSVTQDTTYYYRIYGHNGSPGCGRDGPVSATASVRVTAGPPASPSRILPTAISSPGQFGSLFKTAVQITNPTTSTMSGRFVFHAQGIPGTDSDPFLPYALNPGQTLSYPDILAAMGQSGVGTLDLVVLSGAAPVAVVRVFNDAGSAGTTGFTEELIASGDILSTGDQTVLIAPADLTAFRQNIGIRSMAGGLGIQLVVRDPSGLIVRTISKSYGPNLFQQQTLEDFAGGPVPANSSLNISITSGGGIVYGVRADNRTQDPDMQLGRRILQ